MARRVHAEAGLCVPTRRVAVTAQKPAHGRLPTGYSDWCLAREIAVITLIKPEETERVWTELN